MARIIQFDPDHAVVPNRVIKYLSSANTPEYEGLPNTLINPTLPSGTVYNVGKATWIFWKVVNGTDVVEMTQQEKDDLLGAIQEASKQLNRIKASALLDQPVMMGMLFKALTLGMVNQINTLRALHGLPDINKQQVITFLKNQIENGNAD